MTALPMAKNAPAIRWLFKAGLVVFILLAVMEQSDAAGRSLTSAELFFYQGADREQILLEGRCVHRSLFSAAGSADIRCC